MPAELTFQSKPQLAAAMLEAMAQEALPPFKHIVADCLYGNSPTFLDAVDACVGRTALVAVPSETRCWLQRPQTEAKSYTYKGEARAKRVVVAPDSAPSTVAAVAASLPPHAGIAGRSGRNQGADRVCVCPSRVTLCKEGLPDRTVWLVIKRTLGTEPSYAFAISNAPASTPLSTLVCLSGLRWAVEQCFEESKTELGMDHYEVRKSRGWHHHMLTTMLAHFFLWRLKLRLGKKAPALTVSQLRMLLDVVLPWRTYSVEVPEAAPFRRTFPVHHMPGSPPPRLKVVRSARVSPVGCAPSPFAPASGGIPRGDHNARADLLQFVIRPRRNEGALSAIESSPCHTDVPPSGSRPVLASTRVLQVRAAMRYVPLISRFRATINTVSTTFTFLALHVVRRP